MRDEVIEKLHDLFKSNIMPLYKTSKSNDFHMVESDLTVVNFDKVPNEYSRGKSMRGVPKSNDALYIDEKNNWYFIEFKNGSVEKVDIYSKLYDSLIMLLEMKLVSDFDFCRTNISYILVYNDSKKDVVRESKSLKNIYGYVNDNAKTEEKLFGVERFDTYLVKETHTYTKKIFEEKFVKVMEEKEKVS